MTEERRTPRSAFEILSFKLDRTLAIVGIVLIGGLALCFNVTDSQLGMAAVSGLVGYIGGRAGK
uniref:Uncharacterized protein n=1 Tax=viral metagenome TaxID=1070528 RepID=A0A6H1ZL38_9ZZZZ